jgi:hypothetical protein
MVMNQLPHSLKDYRLFHFHVVFKLEEVLIDYGEATIRFLWTEYLKAIRRVFRSSKLSDSQLKL